MDNLNYAFRYSCTYQCVRKAFSSQGCLWGGFEKDCIAGDNGGEDGVYGDEVWVAASMRSNSILLRFLLDVLTSRGR